MFTLGAKHLTPPAFSAAVAALAEFEGNNPGLRTANFAVAIATLVHGPQRRASRRFPEILAQPGGPVSTTATLATLCNDTYRKAPAFLPPGAQGPIYKPFTFSFKPTTANNWRNSFDLQAGVGCDAPPGFLAQRSYVAEGRTICPYRSLDAECHSPTGLQANNRTCFNPSKRSPAPDHSTRAQQPPKLLGRGIDAKGVNGYWAVMPIAESLLMLLGQSRRRVPLVPFATALYAGSEYMRGGIRVITADVMMDDLGLDPDRFFTIFDPRSSANVSSLRGSSSDDLAEAATALDGTQLAIREFAPQDMKEFELRSAATSDPLVRMRLLEKAHRAHQLALRKLVEHVKRSGLVPREQPGGFDLVVDAGRVAHLFEVKTWNVGNLASQLRSGTSQLYEYRWRNRSVLPATTELYLLLDHPPSDSELAAWYWTYLIEDRGILPCWIDGEAIGTVDGYQNRLTWLAPTS